MTAANAVDAKGSAVIKYLTGATNTAFEATGIAFDRSIGLLIQPGNKYHHRVAAFPMWAADNGKFTVAGTFCPERFRAMLAQPNLRRHAKRCLFVAAPDELTVFRDGTCRGDARKTLEQFPAWAREIRALGYPVALVAQDGLETMLTDVPWDLVDVLFVGGSTEWKLGDGARACIAEARRRGKGAHMGRVNSYKRLALADSWGATTADGTFLKYGPTANVPRLLAWFDKLTQAKAANDNGKARNKNTTKTRVRRAA